MSFDDLVEAANVAVMPIEQLRSYAKNARARIAALTAELEQARQLSIDRYTALSEQAQARQDAEAEVARLREELERSAILMGDVDTERAHLQKQWDEHCAFHGSESPHALQEALHRASDAESACKALSQDLATERAARKEAEKNARVLLDANESLVHTTEQAERERDTALADWRHVIDESAKNRDDYLKQCEALEAVALQNARERYTALARVKDLEAKNEGLGRAKDKFASRAYTAEAALASARAELEAYQALQAGEQIDPPGQMHIERAQELLSSAPSPAPCSGCAELKKNWDACHRQHEQCMKLLERCFCYLPKACKLENLVAEMLSKGELPEGWEDK